MNIGNISDGPGSSPRDAGSEQHDIDLNYTPSDAGVAQDAAPARLSKKATSVPPIATPVTANVNKRVNQDICRNVMNCTPIDL